MLLNENDVQIALLQETILPTNIVISTIGYFQYKLQLRLHQMSGNLDPNTLRYTSLGKEASSW